MRRLHIFVHGRVQGVGYRVWCANEARSRGLEGWVRNRRDGTVEVVAAGDEVAVNALLAACRNGPPTALVSRVEATETAVEALLERPAGERFAVLPTA